MHDGDEDRALPILGLALGELMRARWRAMVELACRSEIRRRAAALPLERVYHRWLYDAGWSLTLTINLHALVQVGIVSTYVPPDVVSRLVGEGAFKKGLALPEYVHTQWSSASEATGMHFVLLFVTAYPSP